MCLLCRSVQLINNLCQEINGKLLRLAAVLPDAATLSPLDYETNKRADPTVLKKLTDHAKFLRVHNYTNVHERLIEGHFFGMRLL